MELIQLQDVICGNAVVWKKVLQDMNIEHMDLTKKAGRRRSRWTVQAPDIPFLLHTEMDGVGLISCFQSIQI